MPATLSVKLFYPDTPLRKINETPILYCQLRVEEIANGKTLVVHNVRNRVRHISGRCGYHHRDHACLHHGRQRIVMLAVRFVVDL